MARTPLFYWMGRMIRAAMAKPEKARSEQVRLEQMQIPAGPTGNDANGPNLMQVSLSRRDFLKASLGATGAVAMWSLLDATSHANTGNPASSTSLRQQNAPEPVAIIGGGLGGLVTAYRLHQQGIPCELYEASHRLGGRVFTRPNFNGDGMFVELGGELVDTCHEDLIALCKELQVPMEHFVQDELGIEPAMFYSQGEVYTEDQVLTAFQGLAKSLASDLKRCFPDGNVQLPTFRQPAQAAWLDRLSLAEYLQRQRDVAPEWLLRLISSAYVGEYGLEAEEQSALNLVLLISTEPSEGFRLFGDSDESMRIRGGNSRLVDALKRAIRGHVPIHYGHRLSRVVFGQSPAPSGRLLRSGGQLNRPGQLQLGMAVGRHLRWVSASRAVFAMPFSVLRDVEGLAQLGLSPLKLRCIREWGYGTNSKQMIGFHSRFWRADHPAISAYSGELITDLPSQCYWETSRLQAGKSGILTNFTGGKAGKTATATQWQTALQELTPLFGDLTTQQDGHFAFLNWHRHPWAKGSYSCPKPGQYTSLMGVAQLPELESRLFFAGEHCSPNFAGYMNGAVESGNTAARQILEKSAQAAVLTKSSTLTSV